MNYTLFAIACYIIMRGMQVLFEEYAQRSWYKIAIKAMTVVMLYAALASLVVWYGKINLLGFDPTK
jgi:succinate dehydrogenase hydrophobic anchor subunit